MAAICTPVLTTRGQGTATATYVRQDTATVTTPYGDRTNLCDIYSFAAVPAEGWTFDHWEIATTYDHGLYMETEDETHETRSDSGSDSDNPLVTDTLESDSSGAPSIVRICETFGTGRYRPYDKTLTYAITAVFRHVDTDLLVNSSTAISPVTLVYDPSTNKLVADY